MKISHVTFKTKACARMLMVSWETTKKESLREEIRVISPLWGQVQIPPQTQTGNYIMPSTMSILGEVMSGENEERIYAEVKARNIDARGIFALLIRGLQI